MSSFCGVVPSAVRSMRASPSVTMSARAFSTFPRQNPRLQPLTRSSAASFVGPSKRTFLSGLLSSNKPVSHVDELSPRAPADIGDSIRSTPLPTSPPASNNPSLASAPGDLSTPPARLPFMPAEGPVAPGASFSPNSPLQTPPSASLDDLAHMPIQIGDLKAMGLNGWFPTRFIQSAFEYVHVFTGLPWWATIVVTTLFVRLSIAPLLIGGVRKAANGVLIAPEAKVLQDAMSKASKQKDAQTVQALSVQLRALYKKHDASPFAQIKLPLISVPLFASFFFAIKAMANLPVPQFTVGGIPGWCEDLTLADPLYILPVVAAGMTSIMIHLGATGTAPKYQPARGQAIAAVMKYGMLLMVPIFGGFSIASWIPIIGGKAVAGFPSAILVYWSTSNMYGATQSMVLRTAWARRRFNLPPTPTAESLGRPIISDREAIRSFWDSQVEAQEAKAIEKQKEALRSPAKKKMTDPEEILAQKQRKLEFERAKAEEDKLKREGWMNATTKRVSAELPPPSPVQAVASAHGVKAGAGDGQGWQAAAASRVGAAGRLSVKAKPVSKADARSAAERELETMRARRMRAEELVAAAAAKRPSPKRK